MVKLKDILFEKVDHYKNHKFEDSDAYTFGFFKDTAYIAHKETHYYLKKKHMKLSQEDELDWKDAYDALTQDYKEMRYIFDYPGRLWKDAKIIALWKCPKPEQIIKYIRLLNNSLLNLKNTLLDPSKAKLYDWKIDINTWYLDVNYEQGKIFDEGLISIKSYIKRDFKYDLVYPGFNSEYKVYNKDIK